MYSWRRMVDVFLAFYALGRSSNSSVPAAVQVGVVGPTLRAVRVASPVGWSLQLVGLRSRRPLGLPRQHPHMPLVQQLDYFIQKRGNLTVDTDGGGGGAVGIAEYSST